MKRLKSDFKRVGILLALAIIFFILAVPVATVFHEPALAPWGMFAGVALMGVALSHVLRRLMFPYIDLEAIARAAMQHAIGAGLVFLGVSVVLTAFLLLMGNLVHAETLPVNAVTYAPVLKAEQAAYWPDMPAPAVLAGQVEQETCISLKHSRCWSPRAELKTAREQGVGLGQITRTSRFDALAEIKASFPQALAGWSWESNLYDAKYQLRALVLKDLQGWKKTIGAATDQDRLAMTLAAYNGGIGGVLSDRKVCAATPGCDQSKWFGHVERTSLKAKVAASGYGKSFFEINREYVRNILLIRTDKYRG
ncbi:hypothetical protein UNDYM_1671 [Undibacterium sp. YM2]|uniref:lytic murein transglycosylase n=1 Tax=Undibacterium sp. YM2 TaxID=2058625 RepID=UPI001331E3DA|nr:lytic murein transglycosylase [Undibacterium sp. YM2]BBB65924.1 hypothetical protein UNDYM_1671 [Undibacterium sp. YM2]